MAAVADEPGVTILDEVRRLEDLARDYLTHSERAWRAGDLDAAALWAELRTAVLHSLSIYRRGASAL